VRIIQRSLLHEPFGVGQPPAHRSGTPAPQRGRAHEEPSGANAAVRAGDLLSVAIIAQGGIDRASSGCGLKKVTARAFIGKILAATTEIGNDLTLVRASALHHLFPADVPKRECAQWTEYRRPSRRD
jgi:hypothetical protein